jgi:hypothetical protein
MINSTFVEILISMILKKRIETFVNLGITLGEILETEKKIQDDHIISSRIPDHISNEWFTAENIRYTLLQIANNLKEDKLVSWTENYPSLKNNSHPKRIGLVTAGNIPLVGFHDLLCVLISGHKLLIKNSSKDEKLMNWLLDLIIRINPEYAEYITVEQNHLKNFDVVIATGSDNTSRYFEYYFARYPHIIRKNRNSVAILNGSETDEEIKLLADDMLLYFGLGCRNVSKLYIHNDIDADRIFNAVLSYQGYMDHNKYMNNYTYNKSVYLMNKVNFLENGFFILKEDKGMASPISVVFYERFSNLEKIKNRILADNEKIQCIVAQKGLMKGAVPFGEAQKPALDDYADHIDTITFLTSL